MADIDERPREEDVEEQDVLPESGAGGRKRLSLKAVAIIAVAVLIGSVVGGIGVGPRLAGGRGAGTASDEPHADNGAGDEHEAAHGGGHGSGEHAAEGAPVLELNNIVVNPAGTDGMRFVMVNFGLVMDDAGVKEALVERELEVRDVISSMLERQTLQMLTSLNARDSLRTLVAESVGQFLPEGTHLQVLVPRFVIQ